MECAPGQELQIDFGLGAWIPAEGTWLNCWRVTLHFPPFGAALEGDELD